MADQEVWQHPIKKVGVIGLGGIGQPISRRLALGGQKLGLKKVAVFDSDKSVLKELGEADFVTCKSIAHLVDMVDLVLLCLAGSGDVGRIARCHEGLLDCMRQGQIIVDHSCSSLDLTRQLGTAFAARGAAFLDAPIGVSGDVSRAIDSGRLSTSIGGKAEAIEAVSPFLRCFADDIIRVGPIGAAQVVRQMGDIVALQTFAALAEALVTARAFGVDGERLFEALAKGDGDSIGIDRSGLADFLGVDDASEDDRISIADAGRRLNDAIELAKGQNLSLTGAGNTLTLLEKAMEKGLGEKGLSGLFSAMQPELGRGRQDDERRRQRA